jgi:hypothetical protein
MLSVAKKSIMLSVFMPSVVAPSLQLCQHKSNTTENYKSILTFTVIVNLVKMYKTTLKSFKHSCVFAMINYQIHEIYSHNLRIFVRS